MGCPVRWQVTYDNKIVQIEIDRETDKCVWIHGRRERKRSFKPIFKSREEAKAHVIKGAKDDLETAKRDVDHYRNRLRDAEAL